MKRPEQTKQHKTLIKVSSVVLAFEWRSRAVRRTACNGLRRFQYHRANTKCHIPPSGFHGLEAVWSYLLLVCAAW